MKQFKESVTLALNAKAMSLKAQGHPIINLTVGELDFDTPKFICDAAYDAMLKGHTKYTAVDGIKELKTAIINKFSKDNGLEFKENEITVGTGGKQVIFNAFFSTLEMDDEVLIPCPYWVSYPEMVSLCNGKSVLLTPNEDFKIDALILEKNITNKTKWLILNSPSNPSGAVYSKEELLKLAEVLLKHPNIFILSDDIYESLCFKEFYNILMVEPKLKDRVLIVNGVSKSHAMTGWRLGYGAGNSSLIKTIANLQSHTTSNPSSISQYAAFAALNGPKDFVNNVKLELIKRKDFLLKELSKNKNIECFAPDGAFYIYAKIVNQDESSFCNELLEKKHIAVVPGEAFGMSPYFRLSYAVSFDLLEQVAKRINEKYS